MTAVAHWTRAYTNDEKVQELRAAAIECQKVLQKRAIQEKKSGSLLRPAEPESESGLLRPAGSSLRTDESVLLRAQTENQGPTDL